MMMMMMTVTLANVVSPPKLTTVFAIVNRKRSWIADREVSDGGRSLYRQQLIEFQVGNKLSTISL